MLKRLRHEDPNCKATVGYKVRESEDKKGRDPVEMNANPRIPAQTAQRLTFC